MKDGSYLKDVRAQYEDFPYPPRKAEDERVRLCRSRSSALECINHYCFKGEQTFNDGFRVLVAGGGTGDCTIFLAEQLRHLNASIVYLDMSSASMAIAKARAKIRGLNNIEWIQESIYNLPELGLGTFDFISCTGVLHHLDDPEKGMRALHSVLADNGSINVMVYASYGRTPIYQLQDLMRRINVGTESAQDKITNTRKTLATLPPTHWLNFNRTIFEPELATDIGLYDLLLHSQDRSFTVPEFYAFGEDNGLVLHTMYEGDHPMGQLLYEPQTFIRDPELLAQVKALSTKEQHAICELIYGQNIKHNAYFAKQEKAAASLEQLELIPVFARSRLSDEELNRLTAIMTSNEPQIRINDFLGINRTALTSQVYQAINDQRSIAEIIETVSQSNSCSPEQVQQELNNLLSILIKASFLYLQSANTPSFRSLAEMEKLDQQN